MNIDRFFFFIIIFVFRHMPTLGVLTVMQTNEFLPVWRNWKRSSGTIHQTPAVQPSALRLHSCTDRCPFRTEDCSRSVYNRCPEPHADRRRVNNIIIIVFSRIYNERRREFQQHDNIPYSCVLLLLVRNYEIIISLQECVGLPMRKRTTDHHDNHNIYRQPNGRTMRQRSHYLIILLHYVR